MVLGSHLLGRLHDLCCFDSMRIIASFLSVIRETNMLSSFPGIPTRPSFHRYYHCPGHCPRRSKACSPGNPSRATPRDLLGGVFPAMVSDTSISAALDQPYIFLYPYSRHNLLLGGSVLSHYQSKASSDDWKSSKRLCLCWPGIIRS